MFYGRWYPRIPPINRRSTRAFIVIFIHCELEQQDIIIDCEFGEQAWDTLKAQCVNSSLSTINRLLHQFNYARMTDDHINTAKATVAELKSSGELISDKQLFNKLISGFLSSFETLKCTLNVQMANLSMPFLTQAILVEEENQSSYRRPGTTYRRLGDQRDHDP